MKNLYYKIVTLGCRTNQYESSAFATQLKSLGYKGAKEEQAADLCIINTCTVTESADLRSRVQVKKLIKENPQAKIYVTGCYAEGAKNLLQDLSERIVVVPNSQKESLLQFAAKEASKELPEFKIDTFEAHTRAFVKVQDGCNSYCSYCIIPYVRGRSVSRSIESVVSEVRGLIEKGYKEVVLTGINIGDFDDAGTGRRLVDLVRAVDQIEGLERLRISSIDPDEVDDALIDAVGNGKRTCHSMHVVLQAGSNVILNRMRRKYSKQDFFDAIGRLKDFSSDFTFTTDVIVGFPGETESDFQETLDVISEVKFAKVHMFPYSKRPKTRAARFTDEVKKEVKEERRQKVLRLSEKVAYELRESFIGRTMPVLLESQEGEDKNCFRGHTENFLEVVVQGEGLSRNQIVKVELNENSARGLIGKAIENCYCRAV